MTNRAMQRCRLVQLRLEPLEPRTVPAFLPGVHYYTGGYPGKPDVADFNLDSNLDVAVPTCFLGQVSVLLGNGDGTLQPQTVFDLNAECTTSVETADMNNDRIPDIQTANDGSASVTVLLGDGNGGFRKPIVNPVPKDVGDIVVRDFNADGLMDAATVDWRNSKIYIQHGKGDGTLEHVGTYGAGLSSIQIVASDFNNDGALDLATPNQLAATMSVLLGNGDGTFKSKVDYPTGGTYPNGIAAADFDNDGASDVVVSNTLSNRISVFKGNGDGTFQGADFYRVRKGPTVPTVGDFNLDGFIDIAVSCQGPHPNPAAVTVLLNDRAGGFVTHSIHLMPFTATIVAGDLNSDTFLDLVSDDLSGVTVFVNDALWGPPLPTTGFRRAEAAFNFTCGYGLDFNNRADRHYETDPFRTSAVRAEGGKSERIRVRAHCASIRASVAAPLSTLQGDWLERLAPALPEVASSAVAVNGHPLWRMFR